MEKEKSDSIKMILRQIPKVFRYLIPGFVFVVLYTISYADPCGKSLKQLLSNSGVAEGYMYLVYLLLVGMVIYGIHRALFWLVDDFIFSRYGTNCWEFFKERYSNTEIADIVDYMEYRWSILHSCLITAELIVVFSLIAKQSALYMNSAVIAVSGLFWGICFFIYCYLSCIEIEEILRKCRNKKNAQEDPSHSANEIGENKPNTENVADKP